MNDLAQLKTRREVEKFFQEQHIGNTQFKQRITQLLEVMGNPEIFFSTGDPTDEIRYEFVLESFLSREWEFAQMCRERANKQA